MLEVPPSYQLELQLRDYRLRKYARELRVDVTFTPGVNVLLGENGAGKTTLLSSLVRRDLRARGSSVIVRRGPEVLSLSSLGVCLLPQHPTLPGHLTVSDVLRYACHVRGVPTGAAAAMLNAIGLSSISARQVNRLSGGETQRVNLAIAFLGSPDLILLDEPSVALDPLARALFANALRSLTTGESIVVMSTHVASDIEVADRVFLMSRTAIEWEGTPTEFLGNAPDGRFDTAFAEILGRQLQ